MRLLTAALIAMAFLAAAAPAHGQEAAEQKRVEIALDRDGGAKVVHRAEAPGGPAKMELVGGPALGLSMSDASGAPVGGAPAEGAVTIPGGIGEVVIEYELRGFVGAQDGLWALDYTYPGTTVFSIPDEADLAFINGEPLYTADDKRFACHGCRMILEYALDEPSSAVDVEWEDRSFPVELRSFSEIGGFEFDQPAKSISFDVGGAGSYVTAVFDLELLGKPYVVMLDGEVIGFGGYDITETRVGLTMRPDSPGRITIMGTTVIPEFGIVPLAAGFAAMLAYPLLGRLRSRRSRTSRGRTRLCASRTGDTLPHSPPPRPPFRTV